jgi:hypothetical protein
LLIGARSHALSIIDHGRASAKQQPMILRE